MIHGAHIVLFSRDADADRAFLRDVLGFPYVDVGHGWLIFALPPSEVAMHPVEGASPPAPSGPRMLGGELYLMCDDVRAEVKALEAKGVTCSSIDEAPWGFRTTVRLPSGGELGLYQPKHALAHR